MDIEAGWKGWVYENGVVQPRPCAQVFPRYFRLDRLGSGLRANCQASHPNADAQVSANLTREVYPNCGTKSPDISRGKLPQTWQSSLSTYIAECPVRAMVGLGG